MGKNKKKRKNVEATHFPPSIQHAEDMTLEMFEATIDKAIRDILTTPTMRKVIANAVHKAVKETLTPSEVPTRGDG